MKEIQKQSKHHQPRVGLFVGVAALAGLLANGVPARSDFVEQFKFSGGIVIALDFNDGESIAELATEGPFVIHGLLRDETRVVAARQAIR